MGTATFGQYSRRTSTSWSMRMESLPHAQAHKLERAQPSTKSTTARKSLPKRNWPNHLACSPESFARADTMYSSIADCREVFRLASWSCSRARGCSNWLVPCGVPSHVAGPSSCADGGGTVGSCSCCDAAGICAAKAALWLAVGAIKVGVIWASANSRRAGGDHIRSPRLGGEVALSHEHVHTAPSRCPASRAAAGQKSVNFACAKGGVIDLRCDAGV